MGDACSKKPLPLCFSAKHPGGRGGWRAPSWRHKCCGCWGSPWIGRVGTLALCSDCGDATPGAGLRSCWSRLPLALPAPVGAEAQGVRDTWVCALRGFLDTETLTPGQSCQLSLGGGVLAGQGTNVLLARWRPRDCLRVLVQVRRDTNCQAGSTDHRCTALGPGWHRGSVCLQGAVEGSQVSGSLCVFTATLHPIWGSLSPLDWRHQATARLQ